MGRPRKRRVIEAQIATDFNMPQDLELPVFDNYESYDGLENVGTEPYFVIGPEPDSFFKEIPNSTKADDGHHVWLFGDRDLLGGPINYGPEPESDDTETLYPEPQLSISNPSLTDSENSPEQSEPEQHSCCCLPSMYLAMDAMNKLPKKLEDALKIVRHATTVAMSSIWCKNCGIVLLESTIVSVESLQNIMNLGMIIPTIAANYHKLLKMIDDEAAIATAAREEKTFSFEDYGGMCGSHLEVVGCNALLTEPVKMPPAQWRSTVRALLRVDMYGHEQGGFKSKGLRDLVFEMEARQKLRHEMMDLEIAAGTLDINKIGHGIFGSDCKAGGETGPGNQVPHCLQIVEMAKRAVLTVVKAMDDLVIP